MKILLATQKPFAASAVAGIREIAEGAGHEVVLLEKYAGQSDLVAAAADADAMIIRSDKVDAEVLDAAKQLKIVVRAGAGYDNVDLEAATQHGVVVMNTPGQNSNAVAELVFGLLVFAVRNFYNGKAGTELMGKKLGILAFGNVGTCHAIQTHGLTVRKTDQDTRCIRELVVVIHINRLHQKGSDVCTVLMVLTKCDLGLEVLIDRSIHMNEFSTLCSLDGERYDQRC